MKTILAIASLLLTACSVAMQKNGESFNYAGSVMGKKAFATMTGPAGEIEGYVTDNTDAAKDIGNTMMGIEGIKGLTKTTVNASNNLLKGKVSDNRTAVKSLGITKKSEVAKEALKVAE